MNRRHALQCFALAGGAGIPALAGAQDAWQDGFARQWRDSYAKHWLTTKEYTLAVFDAMPADGIGFRPTPEQMTFGGQASHICDANNWYFSFFGEKDPLERPDTSSREAVRAYIVGSFDWASGIISNLTESDMNRRDLEPEGEPHTAADMLMRAYMHTTQHRGQLMVYLRLKGVTPPGWLFRPTA